MNQISSQVDGFQETKPREGLVADAADLVVFHGQVVQLRFVAEQSILNFLDSVGVHVQFMQVVWKPTRDIDQLVVAQPYLCQVR